MKKTVLSIKDDKFLINDRLTYTEIENSNPKTHGLLMNARFIQAIFDTTTREKFNRYGKIFNPEKNTDELVENLKAWYNKGIRCITIGMQGGGSCFTVDGSQLNNNPYSPDGLTVDKNYLARLDKVLKACDELGMAVIVSYLYSGNVANLCGAQAVINVVKTMTTYIKNTGYKNIIIEIANEYDVFPQGKMDIIKNPQGMVSLINIAKEYSGGIPVGCSGGGGTINEEICKASDVVLLHSNGQSRSRFYNMIVLARKYSENKPVVFNEDSQAIGQLLVCEEMAISWGYYNNMTKQEPPTYWEITKGEDEFFAWRLADMIGIEQEPIPEDEMYYLQGLEDHMHCNNERFVRVASLYPEKIDYVKFYKNSELVYVCYEEPFSLYFNCNWLQHGIMTKNGDIFEAEIYLRNGSKKVLTKKVKNLR